MQGMDNNKATRGLLEWLWKTVVQLVLRELGFQALPAYGIAHFASHGVSEESEPNLADTHLLLLKGTGEVDKLCVKDIAALKLPVANHSACSTARCTS